MSLNAEQSVWHQKQSLKKVYNNVLPRPDGEGEVHGGGHGEAAHDDDPHEAGGQELEGGVLQQTEGPAQGTFQN